MTNSSETGSSFRGLSNYMENEQKMEWRETRNLPDRNRNEDIRMMEELAETSRAEQPVYHLSLNYADGDNPSKEMMLQDANRTLSTLDLADHQAVIVSHKDTDHRHVHIMVNRIHQDKPRAHNVWRDRTRLKNICGEIEKEQGYELVSAGRQWKAKDLNLSKGEFSQLRKKGFEKMPLVAKAKLFKVDQTIREAKSWNKLQSELAKVDMQITPKGRGGVIQDTHTGKTLKLSRVDRKHSFGKLQRRFGKFKEYQRSIEVSRDVGKAIPDQEIGKATARIVREGYGGQVISKGAKKQFKSAVKGAWNTQKSIAKIGKLMAGGGPAAAPLKWAMKVGKSITKQLNQNRDRGLSQ